MALVGFSPGLDDEPACGPAPTRPRWRAWWLSRVGCWCRSGWRQDAVVKPPVLLMHGDQDQMVPFEDMGLAGDALIAGGVRDLWPCDEGHGPRHCARRAVGGDWHFCRTVCRADCHRRCHRRGLSRSRRDHPCDTTTHRGACTGGCAIYSFCQPLRASSPWSRGRQAGRRRRRGSWTAISGLPSCAIRRR